MSVAPGIKNIKQSSIGAIYLNMEIFINPQKNTWPQILQRPTFGFRQLESKVSLMLDDVKLNGDTAVKKYTAAYDGVQLDEFAVTEKEIAEALVNVDAGLKAAIDLAKNNITAFHSVQKEVVAKADTSSGVLCWRKSVAIEKVGLYIPGGTAPLFSTLLMLGIPAVLAGCKDIIVCTPPDKNMKINPVILYVAQLIGIKNIYKIGGVQAIAAMSYGTQTVSSARFQPAPFHVRPPEESAWIYGQSRRLLSLRQPSSLSLVAPIMHDSSCPRTPFRKPLMNVCWMCVIGE